MHEIVSNVMRKTKTTALAAALDEKGLSFKELAHITQRDVRTLHNLASGNSKSKALRQLVSNILGKKIWHDVEVNERVMTLRPGTEIEWPTVAFAREFAEWCGGAAVRRGRTVGFIRPCTISIESEPSAKTQILKVSARGSE